jgi:hypothetical protein
MNKPANRPPILLALMLFAGLVAFALLLAALSPAAGGAGEATEARHGEVQPDAGADSAGRPAPPRMNQP